MSYPEIASLALAGIAAVYLYLEAVDFRVQRDEHKADADYWLNYACYLEGRGPAPYPVRISATKAAQLAHDLKYGFADEFPRNVPLGTSANPIRCPNGDSARYSTLDELTRGKR